MYLASSKILTTFEGLLQLAAKYCGMHTIGIFICPKTQFSKRKNKSFTRKI
jgi:hypothetical protein